MATHQIVRRLTLTLNLFKTFSTLKPILSTPFSEILVSKIIKGIIPNIINNFHRLL